MISGIATGRVTLETVSCERITPFLPPKKPLQQSLHRNMPGHLPLPESGPLSFTRSHPIAVESSPGYMSKTPNPPTPLMLFHRKMPRRNKNSPAPGQLHQLRKEGEARSRRHSQMVEAARKTAAEFSAARRRTPEAVPPKGTGRTESAPPSAESHPPPTPGQALPVRLSTPYNIALATHPPLHRYSSPTSNRTKPRSQNLRPHHHTQAIHPPRYGPNTA